jgi:hypothetical protein
VALLLAEDKAVLPAGPLQSPAVFAALLRNRCPAQLSGISQASLCRTRPGLDLFLPLARATDETGEKSGSLGLTDVIRWPSPRRSAAKRQSR